MAKLNDAIGALPQHPPMRLLDRAVHIDAERAEAQVDIRTDSPFLITTPLGPAVPTWVALEYLGQTAALIGQARAAGPPDEADEADRDAEVAQDGFLLGSRQLDLDSTPFGIGETLTVVCTARGELGGSLATFEGEVRDAAGRVRASGILSVVRVPRDKPVTGTAADSTPEPTFDAS